MPIKPLAPITDESSAQQDQLIRNVPCATPKSDTSATNNRTPWVPNHTGLNQTPVMQSGVSIRAYCQYHRAYQTRIRSGVPDTKPDTMSFTWRDTDTYTLLDILDPPVHLHTQCMTIALQSGRLANWQALTLPIPDLAHKCSIVDNMRPIPCWPSYREAPQPNTIKDQLRRSSPHNGCHSITRPRHDLAGEQEGSQVWRQRYIHRFGRKCAWAYHDGLYLFCRWKSRSQNDRSNTCDHV